MKYFPVPVTPAPQGWVVDAIDVTVAIITAVFLITLLCMLVDCIHSRGRAAGADHVWWFISHNKRSRTTEEFTRWIEDQVKIAEARSQNKGAS